MPSEKFSMLLMKTWIVLPTSYREGKGLKKERERYKSALIKKKLKWSVLENEMGSKNQFQKLSISLPSLFLTVVSVRKKIAKKKFFKDWLEKTQMFNVDHKLYIFYPK